MNCPHWSPVRDLGYPQDLWRRDTKLRVLVGGVLLGRGAAVRALLATCAPSPCASKIRRKPEAFSLRGLGPPRTERVRGVALVGRAGPGEEPYLFSVREDQSLYNTSQSAPSGRMGSFGTESQHAIVLWCLPERNEFGGWYGYQDPGREKHWPSPRPGVDCYNISKKKIASRSRITVLCMG